MAQGTNAPLHGPHHGVTEGLVKVSFGSGECAQIACDGQSIMKLMVYASAE